MTEPKRLFCMAFTGWYHQVTSPETTPVQITAAPMAHANLTPNQRSRVTLWAQARRWVPSSNSRATSGAPRKSAAMRGNKKPKASTRSKKRLYCPPLEYLVIQVGTAPQTSGARPKRRVVSGQYFEPADEQRRGRHDEGHHYGGHLAPLLAPGEPGRRATSSVRPLVASTTSRSPGAPWRPRFM
jgi:hypothetical protein